LLTYAAGRNALKLLYTAVTRAQRRLNFVETAPSKSAAVFSRRLEEKGKLVKLVSDKSELSLATGMMSPDEWRDLATDCFGKAGSSGQSPLVPRFSFFSF
jgi:hypothetical protein